MSSSSPPKITLYVDTISPFAYEGFIKTNGKLQNDKVFTNCEVTYVPIFLGGVMKACGNVPPVNIKNKSEWIDVERVRWAKFFSIPMKEKAPDGFPPLTLTIMRALCVITVLYPGPEGQTVLIKCLDKLFQAYWVDHQKTYEKEVLVEVLGTLFSAEEVAKIFEMVPKEGKEILGKNTDQALADGAFGLPWFVVTNSKGQKETFWGVDHLGQITAHLGIEKPKTGGWKALL